MPSLNFPQGKKQEREREAARRARIKEQLAKYKAEVCDIWTVTS
jgi:hypothetical protein